MPTQAPDGVPARLVTALASGYVVERKLRQGGMATVYLARDLRHERMVALKVLRPELAAVVGAERFLAEIKTTANLHHPHILPLHDSGASDGFLWYVMPYVEGESLAERLQREKQLPVSDAVSIATKVLAALQHAHERGVIHRDIKPSNILLQDGEPVLADFGIALAVGEASGSRLTETGLSLGTPHYMSPEQATGDQRVGAPSDTYGLACVLFEMLAGEPPYTGKSAQAVMAQIVTGERPTAISRRPTIPINVDAAIQRALEKLPADRFASASEFAKALNDPSFRNGDSTSLSDRIDAVKWKRRSLATGSIAILSILAFAWSVLPFSTLESRQPGRSLSIGAPTVRTYIPVPRGLGGGGPRRFAISSDGSQVVYRSFNDQGSPTLFLWLTSDSEARPLVGTEDIHAEGNPVFSPDGQWILYTNLHGHFRKVHVSGGAPQTVFVPPPSPSVASDTTEAFFQFWGADGFLYFKFFDGVERLRSRIARTPERGGPPEILVDTVPGFRHFDWPVLLPGGKLLLFNSWAPESELFVLNLDTREVKGLGIHDARHAQYVPTGHLLYVSFPTDSVLWAVPFDLRRLEVTGRPVQVLRPILTTNNSGQFHVSDNGVAIFQQRGEENRELVIVDSTGQERVLSVGAGQLAVPRFSPDGRRIAYLSGAKLFVYDLNLDRSQQLTYDGNANDPTWSADGAWLTYASGDVYLIRSDGTGTPALLFSRPGAQRIRASASDGRLLIFENRIVSSGRGTPGQIVNPGLVILTRRSESFSASPYLSSSETRTESASISPDSRFLAYDVAGTGGVWVRPFPDATQGRWLVSRAGRHPLWSQDATKLFYWEGSDLKAASLPRGPSVGALGTETLITDRRYPASAQNRMYDIDPNTGSVVFVRPTGESAQLTLVVNWFEELLRQMAAAQGRDRGGA
jgi:serine/threonine protein kinase